MDNFIVSARKYRPATFATVVGQSAITNTLKNAIKNQQIAQAFLFTGPRGVGKTTCARILAKTINCSAITADGEACDKCPSCLSFNKSGSFNIFELDAASNNTVDDIRNLVDQVRIPPQQGYKVYIVDEVHMLSQSAFNAFLKTLEEPPPYAKFILATTEKHKILPTILSRCQIFDFRRISVDDISHHLQYVADSEHVDAEPEALHIIAQKADGGLRDALSMFDQLVSFSGNQLTYKQVIENLNVLDYEYYFKITDSILAGDISNTLLTINEILDNGFEGQHFITGLGQHLRNLMVSKDTVTLQLLETSNAVRNQYSNQANRCSISFLLQSLGITNQCDIDYKTSNNKKLHIEIALMQLCRLSTPSLVSKAPEPVNTPSPNIVVPQSAMPKQEQPVKESGAAGEKGNIDPSAQKGKGNQESGVIRADIVGNKADTTDNKADTIVEQAGQQATSKTPSLSGLNLGNLMSGKKEIKNDDSKEGEDDVPGESYGNQYFTISELLKIWPLMVNELAGEMPLLQSTLTWKAPDLLENFVISISIENPLQQEEIFKTRNELTLFLRKGLKNDAISIVTNIIESNSPERRPYTDNEKFDFIANRAPVIKTMKDQLGLELDM